ncbi:DMT family transporter [Propionivibrio limicola]|uniref:DMT family transporter n=1 Tax=Propionivibrio limicola TaxID=167645 RepID=UPI0012924F26|nr:DMT family transporter [Propionivibrio limicola]
MTPKTPESARILRGMLLISVAVVLFAIMDTISKYLTRFYPPTGVLFARYLFHTLLVVVVLVPRRGAGFMRTVRPGIQIVRGVMLAAASLCFVTAVKYMPIAEATAIQFLSPLIVTSLAVFFLKEPMDRARWAAVLAGFLGVLIIIRPGSGVFSWYALLPLGTAVLFASYQVITRRLAGMESVYTSIFYPGVVGTLMLACTLPFAWVPPQSVSHCVLLALAGIIGGSAHLILIQAYEHAPASRLAPFSYAQLIWVTLTGYLVFDNLPDFWSFVGIAVLAASGIFTATRQHLAGRKR